MLPVGKVETLEPRGMEVSINLSISVQQYFDQRRVDVSLSGRDHPTIRRAADGGDRKARDQDKLTRT